MITVKKIDFNAFENVNLNKISKSEKFKNITKVFNKKY